MARYARVWGQGSLLCNWFGYVTKLPLGILLNHPRSFRGVGSAGSASSAESASASHVCCLDARIL